MSAPSIYNVGELEDRQRLLRKIEGYLEYLDVDHDGDHELLVAAKHAVEHGLDEVPPWQSDSRTGAKMPWPGEESILRGDRFEKPSLYAGGKAVLLGTYGTRRAFLRRTAFAILGYDGTDLAGRAHIVSACLHVLDWGMPPTPKGDADVSRLAQRRGLRS
jgi:hypothetical protein